MECLLRAKDIDFGSNQIMIREGKGDKDRITMLPGIVRKPLVDHLERVKKIHNRDLGDGYGRVVMPNAIDRKYPNAPAEWAGNSSFHNSIAGLMPGPGDRDAIMWMPQ